MELETPEFKRCGSLLDHKEKFSVGLHCELPFDHPKEQWHECSREEYWPNNLAKLLWRGHIKWQDNNPNGNGLNS